MVGVACCRACDRVPGRAGRVRDCGGVRFWFDAAGGLVARVLACGLWRGGGEDALVADGEQAGQP